MCGNEMSNLLTVSRWDALIYGEYKLIPSPPGTAARPRMSFHTRPPEVVLAEGFTADENFINRFRTRVRYLINITNSEWDNAETGTVIHAGTMGYTQYLPNFDISRITLASQVIGPLLREDISDSQRLVMQFQLAKTVSHAKLSDASKLTSELDPTRIRRKFHYPHRTPFKIYSSLEQHAIGFLLRVDDDLLEYDEPCKQTLTRNNVSDSH